MRTLTEGVGGRERHLKQRGRTPGLKRKVGSMVFHNGEGHAKRRGYGSRADHASWINFVQGRKKESQRDEKERTTKFVYTCYRTGGDNQKNERHRHNGDPIKEKQRRKRGLEMIEADTREKSPYGQTHDGGEMLVSEPSPLHKNSQKSGTMGLPVENKGGDRVTQGLCWTWNTEYHDRPRPPPRGKGWREDGVQQTAA